MQSSDYHKFAEQCVQFAKKALPEHRQLLLDMAERWRELAARMEEQETKN